MSSSVISAASIKPYEIKHVKDRGLSKAIESCTK